MACTEKQEDKKGTVVLNSLTHVVPEIIDL